MFDLRSSYSRELLERPLQYVLRALTSVSAENCQRRKFEPSNEREKCTQKWRLADKCSLRLPNERGADSFIEFAGIASNFIHYYVDIILSQLLSMDIFTDDVWNCMMKFSTMIMMMMMLIAYFSQLVILVTHHQLNATEYYYSEANDHEDRI